jgi:hypothetical protein
MIMKLYCILVHMNVTQYRRIPSINIPYTVQKKAIEILTGEFRIRKGVKLRCCDLLQAAIPTSAWSN